ncbi:MAG: hypothetical protein U0263_36250 [Polyangiaceae bacterium]
MRAWWTAALLVSLCAGCSGAEDDERDPGDWPGIYVVPASIDQLAEESFFDHPWPSDLRKEGDGSVRFDGFPNPHKKPILSEYIESMKGVLTGFSPVAAGYARFTVPSTRRRCPRRRWPRWTRPRACSSSTSIPRRPSTASASASRCSSAATRGPTTSRTRWPSCRPWASRSCRTRATRWS